MRLAAAYEACEQAEPPLLERAFQRILTPASKFWVCKRAVESSGEAMEVLGGNGYVEPAVVARLFREAPVNSIWEGSGNVMCLDVLRAIARESDAVQALWLYLHGVAADEPILLARLQSLQDWLQRPQDEQEMLARLITQTLVLLTQACLLRQRAPRWVADAFITTRMAMDGHSTRVIGAVDWRGTDLQALLDRALPL